MNTYYTSELIKHLRVKNNLTIQDIADYLGVSKVAVCKWEKGDDIKIEHLYSLAQLFDVSLSELVNGELNADSTSNYLRKDYNLSNFKFDEIDDKNLNKIQKYYECYSKIENRFFELELKHVQNTISEAELKEYYKLKEYYYYDEDYFTWAIVAGKIEGRIEDNASFEQSYYENIITDVMNKCLDLSKEEKIWELSKFYKFNRDLKINEIIESQNLKAIDYLFQSLNQQDKDYFFNNYLCYVEDEEESFANDPFHIPGKRMERMKIYGLSMGDELVERVMFKNKAHCFNDILFLYNHFEVDTSHISDIRTDLLDHVKGFKEIDENCTKVNDVLVLRYDLFNKKTFWKCFSLSDYNQIVDMNKTRYFKDRLRLRDKDPILYLNNIVNGKY